MRSSVLLAVCVLANCGSDGDSRYFLGPFNGAYMLTIEQTAPWSMTLESQTGRVDLTFTRVEGHSFEVNDTLTGCRVFFEQSDETHAAAPRQDCTTWIHDGTVRTLVRSCTVTSTNAELSMTCSGSVSGSDVDKNPYAGSYTSSFSGSRIKLL